MILKCVRHNILLSMADGYNSPAHSAPNGFSAGTPSPYTLEVVSFNYQIDRFGHIGFCKAVFSRRLSQVFALENRDM